MGATARAVKSARPAQDPIPNARASEDAAAVWMDIAALIPWVDNPRKNEGRPVATVAELIRTLGWGRTLGAWRGRLVWGHTARLAALTLIERWRGLSEAQRKAARESESRKKRWHPEAIRTAETNQVPVRHRDDLTERQANQMALADNRTNELAEWDMPPLQDLLGDYDTDEVESMGWNRDELDKMAKDLLGGGADDDEEDGADDQSDKAKTDFAVLVECADEQEQLHVLTKLESLGMRCRALV